MKNIIKIEIRKLIFYKKISEVLSFLSLIPLEGDQFLDQNHWGHSQVNFIVLLDEAYKSFLFSTTNNSCVIELGSLII